MTSLDVFWRGYVYSDSGKNQFSHPSNHTLATNKQYYVIQFIKSGRKPSRKHSGEAEEGATQCRKTPAPKDSTLKIPSLNPGSPTYKMWLLDNLCKHKLNSLAEETSRESI